MLLDEKWKIFLDGELNKDYFYKLQEFVDYEYQTNIIYPPYENIFRAFNLLPPEDVKVVIIGQDPYHGPNQAQGLAFSVCDSCPLPPSLKNIFKELMDDMQCKPMLHGNLSGWASQGVLLINTILTVRSGEAFSHKSKGWEIFTDYVLKKISDEMEHVVFILWGLPSQKKEKYIDRSKHHVIKSAHPSPLSAHRGFFGSKPFSQTNSYLKKYARGEIEWCLSEKE